MLLAATCGYGLVATANADAVTAQTVTAPVEADGMKCDKVLLNRDGSSLVANFLVQQMPTYNNYSGTIAEYTIDSSNTDLKMLSSQVATWLIFIDISDPSGRKQVIQRSAAVAARLVSLMSKDSQVNVVVAAGSQYVAAQTGDLVGYMKEGKDLSPVCAINNKLDCIFQGYGYEDLASRIISAQGIQNNNTNLWIGLTRAIKEQMPDSSHDYYRYLPRGVIMISDGADESDSSDEDFRILVDTAKSMNIPVHTIAFPFKDQYSVGKKAKHTNTSVHKGFAAMQRLAVQTNGLFLQYEEVKDPNEDDGIANLQKLVRATSAGVLKMSMPMTTKADSIIPGGRALKLYLNEGQTRVATLNVRQEELGMVIADFALEHLYNLRSSNEDKAAEKMLQIFKAQLMPLSDINKLFENTSVDRDYARRVKQLLQHIKNTKGLQEHKNLDREIVACLVDTNHPLPEPPNPDTNVTVNNNSTSHNSVTTSGAASGDGYAEEDTPSLVWWVVGIGGAFACIIVFIIIVRTMNRDDDDDEPVAPRGMPSAPQAPAPAPAPIATLDDAKQPGQSWAVRKTSVTVGRSASADVRLPSGHVSNIHFTLYRESNGQWMVKDANSTNGTIVNGSTISAATPVNPGDIISVADMQLVFRLK